MGRCLRRFSRNSKLSNNASLMVVGWWRNGVIWGYLGEDMELFGVIWVEKWSDLGNDFGVMKRGFLGVLETSGKMLVFWKSGLERR